MAAPQHPLKRDIEKASQLINEVHQLYNLYFQGIEKFPPHKKCKELDDSITWLRSEVGKKSNAGLTFALRQVDSRYLLFRGRWDKTVAAVEAGTFRIPPKRK